MSIIALDPGGTTGVALLDTEHVKIRAIQLGPDEHHCQLFDLLFMERPSILICEKFAWRGKYTDTTALEYVGIAKLYCGNDATIFQEQSPSQAKKFWTDDKLKALDLYFEGLRHARDAVRHLLYYLTFECGDQRWVRKLSGRS